MSTQEDGFITFNVYNTFYSIISEYSKVLLIINSEGNTSENFVGLLNFSHVNYYNVSKISSNGLSFYGGSYTGWLTFKRDDTSTNNTYSITAIIIA